VLFISQFINGLQLGSIYALVALGYNMVYGIVKLLNFAHGDIIMVGAYIALFSLTADYHPVLAALLTVGGCALLAVIIEKTTYAPLRLAPRLSLLITAIGVSILLQNLAQLWFGTRQRPFPADRLLPVGSISVGGATVGYTSLLTIAISVAAMIVLTFLVRKTKLGKAMRAVSEDTGAAQLMGVNVNVVITFTFAVGAALAGVGALMYGVRFPQITPTIGAMLGLKAFVAAVFGGIGSIPGAMAGGFVIGLLEVLVISAGLSGWVDGVVFMLLIIVLLLRPTGIMGRNMMEKV
jgi:branched-chain amino acid transport system permease protein